MAKVPKNNTSIAELELLPDAIKQKLTNVHPPLNTIKDLRKYAKSNPLEEIPGIGKGGEKILNALLDIAKPRLTWFDPKIIAALIIAAGTIISAVILSNRPWKNNDPPPPPSPPPLFADERTGVIRCYGEITADRFREFNKDHLEKAPARFYSLYADEMSGIAPSAILQQIVGNQSCRYLTYISFGVTRVDNETLNVASHFPNLRFLFVGSIHSKITNEGVKKLIKSHLLLELDLGYAKIDDEAIVFLPKTLQKLWLSNTGVSDQSLLHLEKQCPHLEYLNLKECENVTARGIANFTKRAKEAKKNIYVAHDKHEEKN